MTFDMERFVEEAQNHPIDPNIILRIAEEHHVSPRVLNDVLGRCSRAWDGERQMLEWSLHNLHNTAFKLMVTNVSDEYYSLYMTKGVECAWNDDCEVSRFYFKGRL